MTKRRFGSIRQLPSGRWPTLPTPDGKRTPAPGTFHTKADAETWLDSRQHQIYAGWLEEQIERPEIEYVSPPIRQHRQLVTRYLCMWAGCRNMEAVGNLCSGHNAVVLAMCAERLAPYGVTPIAVSITTYGYITVKVEPRGHYVREHKLIMERVLGRKLRGNENVHHRNGDRADNRPENLELWVKSQPAGQRPDDLVAHAKQILRHYGERTG